MEKIELLGGACFSHGPYTFYKAVRISNGRVLRLGSFFLTKLWSDADLVSIGELQLLWMDSRGPNQPLASLRLYFLPENTPDGRRDTHGEDEVLTISEKVVVRVHDLVTWLSPTLEWSWGREVSYPTTPTSSPETSPLRYEMPQPQVLTDPGIDFSDVDKQQKEYETNLNCSKRLDNFQTKVVVLSYPRYCRYRALLRRLEGAEPSWLCSSIAAALGGFTATPGTRVLFCRDTFDYPDLETHELLCNHLAPKLKGRPRRKRKKRSASPGESSNESEASVASTSKSTLAITSTSLVIPTVGRPPSSGVRRSERKTSAEEKKFITDVQSFMNSRVDLFLFYTKVQMLGGYDSVSAGRLWKTIYDDIGGNTGSTSAATITRRHYERLLLPYERYQRGEETKVRLNHGRRAKSMSMSDDLDIKEEPSDLYMSETPPPIDAIPTTTTSPLQPIMSATTTTLLSSEKPKGESGKTSSLRSVRVKPERLKSLNTIIANNATPSSQQASQLPSPPPSSNTSISTPNSTPSTTPTNGTSNNQSVLERQLNSPLISQQVPPSCSPPGLPVTSVPTNASTVVTLTPPPEKDMKEIKLDPKQTTLLAQGKENIPLFGGEKFAEKTMVPPVCRSPEVIDLENESDTSRDKIIIPSFKKRKLEILREGGLEVTAVELDARPSVIQSNVAVSPQQHQQQQQPSPLPATMKSTEERQPSISPYPLPVTPNSIPKLISVTVTPDIGHMLPSPQDHHQNHQSRISAVKQLPAHHNNNNINMMNNNNVTNSRVINLGNSNNAALLQLYANANVVPSTIPSAQQPNHRFVPPNIPNGRLLPPKVTQSRSIFVHNERTVYGNPKDILVSPPKYRSPHSHPSPHPHPHSHLHPHQQQQLQQQQQQQQQRSQHPQMSTNNDIGQGGSVLDLTQKSSEKPTFPRPSLEIVRVPVVQRPNPLNLDVRNPPAAKEKPDRPAIDCPKRVPFPAYQNVIDSRTIASNNLEITLVNPKHKNNHHPSMPSHVQIPSPPNKSGAIGTLNSAQRRQQQQPPPPLPPPQQQPQQVNGKYTVRSEPVSPYTPRKPSHPIIPNVPNLNHLNHANASPFPRMQTTTMQPQMSIDRRKAAAEAGRDHQHRRISEGEKSSLAAQQQQQQQQHQHQESRQNEAGRRHSLPSIPSGFVPTIPQNNSTGFPLPQLPNVSGKFLPPAILDPMYYSAFYNGLFPPPIPPTAAAAAATSSFLPPEFSAYYKELLASSQPRLTGMTGQPPHQQPAAPTSK
ncbi:AT-rich interactive domain-containing protein 5B isoform X2 [Solenopsis invicta]|uniref:AT-rich interactive domain-containing protein 5B isoform X2 n=1 Tax=Solenopsis invicta TaxID=13686 RepID=UPI000E33D58C|nr:AT-rich interactive domain-containing protein 5B isoform X2 [Solenopsis invicta]